MTQIIKICDGIYRNEGEEGESQIVHEQETLIRFMDRFYLRCEPDKLTAVEVSVLCQERSKNPTVVLGPNRAVQDLFRRFIDSVNPKNLLEIGAGSNPILSAQHASMKGMVYQACDADPTYAELFSGQSPELRQPDGFFEVICAVFVLHFPFYEAQIKEIFRCMAPSGVFLANVYWRSAASRLELLNSFHLAGFSSQIIKDPAHLCRDHEYWILGKQAAEVWRAASSFSRLIENAT